MLRETIKDSAEILNNILNQPLDIPGIAENISLLQAVQNYPQQQPELSDLSKMLQTFAHNPVPTQTLIQELQLIINDLSAG